MRFQRLAIAAFGPLQQRSFAVDSDLVLVCGPNEAGKSSLRAAIETLLFGFRPADRDQHPLALWDPDRPQSLELACELQLDTGECLTIERALQRTGKLRITRQGAEIAGKQGGNRALPWVEWIAREVFGQLYSLELAQLAQLDERARGDVDDLLLPRTSALPLRAPSEIRAELRKACSALWRADNRGKTAVREQHEALARAREALHHAQQRDRELRGARAERAELAPELEALRARKRELERERADASFLGDLFECNRMRRALGDELGLGELGERRLLRPSELDERIAARDAQLREPRARLAREPRALGDAAARLLERASEIDRAASELARWEADRERLVEQRLQALRLRERASGELRDAIGGQPGEAEIEAAAAVPIEALASASAEWSSARDRALATDEPARGRARILEIAAGGAGIALIALGAFAPRPAVALAAGALLLAAALGIGAFARARQRRELALAPPDLAALFGELEVPRALAASPAALQRLVGLLAGVQRSCAELRGRERDIDELETRLRERERDWSALCERVAVESDADGQLLVARLRAALEAARSERAELERDRLERESAQQLVDAQQPLLDADLEHRASLRALLTAAEPACDDLDLAFERVEQRRRDAIYLRRRESELRADARFASFASDPRVTADQPPAGAPWLPEVSEAREQQLEELERKVAGGQHRLGQLSALLARDEAGAISAASSAVLEIEAEIESRERERDRLALLECVLARAEREFRERHQPDVLRLASRYLERITDGRYRRIDLIDGDARRLAVALDARSEPVAVGAPLSQGTQDQIFLCLRLGLLDHLDERRERLPLILDDALLRMDDRRRRGVYALLAEMAPTRQIWILTCQRALADEIEADLKVARIEL